MELQLLREWDRFLEARGLSDETRRTYRYGVLRFLTERTLPSLEAVKERDVVEFLASIGKHAPARATYLRGLRSLFSWLRSRGHISTDPTELLRVKKPPLPEVVALSPEELRSVLIAAASKSERRFWTLLLCYALGTRRMELAAIRPEDVDVAGGVVNLVVTKGSKPRRVEIGPLAEAALEGLRPYWNGTILGGIHRASVTRWMSEAGREAGLPPRKRRAHVLRATFATHLLEHGVPISVVSALLGHSNVAITSRYLAVDADARRRAVMILPSRLN